ncbi:hypothetical protein AB1A81_10515 [Bdellovibrio bacteriovorus]|uniref:Uncharacterized protein n=1 Tax=Bdellovibrio bacteriovorus (strain ATCC 15356 / DSM 50701 / NCIMB 9529 / HD100) TaxID=264462 RepID=Q6MKT5_BDEBA|nr:hypothetical protein [Bdellovibrio bacteriovorus]CAE80122.1 hypothetical protein predicted by Glimmer/Critica [Bdellovibrio bacteriovorus HD100]
MKTVIVVSAILFAQISSAANLTKADCELILSIPEVTEEYRQTEYNKCLADISYSIDEQMTCANHCDLLVQYGAADEQFGQCVSDCLEKSRSCQ